RQWELRKAGVPGGPGSGYENPCLETSWGQAPRTGRERNSFCTLTLEALPRLDYYRENRGSAKRPSLGELHGDHPYSQAARTLPSQHNSFISSSQLTEDGEEETDKKGTEPGTPAVHVGIKLGWIEGVLIPCLLNIWGVMLFLRLAWVVAQAGVGMSLVIIAISAIVCVITTLSLSAISTNGEVKGGGVYYIISRSLGPEFGASVGVILAFANAVSASMNTIGFCNSLNDLLAEYSVKLIDGGINNVRVIGIIAILVMVIICAIGMEWESKAQNFLLVVIVAAIFDFLVGAVLGPTSDLDKAKGFHGFSLEVMKENWSPNYRYSENVQQDFFSVFAIFFPSVTGIQAGANISGDLKDPAGAIPKGTLLSLAISMFSYALFVVFAGAAAIRDASGSVSDLVSNNITACVSDHDCKYGLHNDYTVMQLMSAWGLLIYAGCFAATLSTALTNLLSVPRLIQALGIDHIYPGLIFFSKGYGKSGEPYRGYVLTFLISSAFVIIADLNAIAPLISNFYLASYALINFCNFHAELIKPLGWRPTFKFYNMWLSMFGFFACVLIMFLIDWRTSLITFGVFFVLYIVVVYRKPDANWGSSTQAQVYKTALMTVQKLAGSVEHVKNYRPQVLVLSGPPESRPALVDLANLITKHNSLLICADISKERLSHRNRESRVVRGQDWLTCKKVKGFFTLVDGLGPAEAARSIIQTTGVGKLRPNVLMMGYKSDWAQCPYDDLNVYFSILHEAFANRFAVVILRHPSGLDFSLPTTIEPVPVIEELAASMTDLTNGSALKGSPDISRIPSQASFIISGNVVSDRAVYNTGFTNGISPSNILRTRKKATTDKMLLKYPNEEEYSKAIIDDMRIFDKKFKGGYLDVWWLYDDGGFAILLPYILSTRQIFSSCRMRVFAIANRNYDLKTEEASMASLLGKFRIEYESLTMINDIMEAPQASTREFFDDLLKGFRENTCKEEGAVVTEEELENLKEKTDRQLRLRELLQKHSKDSTLVVMSLPMPRKGLVSAAHYMAWLECLTRGMPPFILLRGNQTPVITFYS
ncbi:unnamed protein product, partial [Nezara viridula]